MKFGPVALRDALGGILAHSVRVSTQKLRKGLVLEASHIAALAASGVQEVIVAHLEAGDLDENTAALQLAQALVPDPAGANLRLTAPFTGRVNLLADTAGVVELDVAALEQVNQVHPMITIATVPSYQQMAAGGMVATIKIISYGVPKIDLVRAGGAGRGALRLLAPQLQSAGLVLTHIPGGPDPAKGIAAVKTRLEALGLALSETVEVGHAPSDISGGLQKMNADLLMILTGSATSDIADVAPTGVRLAGGQVHHFGMPVDPGNLLFLGELDARPVIGLPGCARSPALNGADWVLSRIACGVAVTSSDIAAMGVGGLLKEIPTRPQPRKGPTAKP
ncbi:MAG: molybdopterin-binding protein [Sedimentitalea sp.]